MSGFAAGTPVLTHQGYKAIETVRPTDTLVSPTGALVSIQACRRYAYDRRLFSICRTGPDPIVCAEDQPFQLQSGVWKPARLLAVDDSIAYPAVFTTVKDDPAAAQTITAKWVDSPQILYTFDIDAPDGSYIVGNTVVHV